MTQPIHRQLRAIRRALRIHQRDLAALLGVHPDSITKWDTGRRAPFVHHAHAYASTVHYQLAATIDGAIIGDLVDVLPTLPALRCALGITQEEMGRRTGTSELSVQGLERRIRSGDSIILPTAEWYVPGFGYQVQLMPAPALERAA